MIKNEETQPFSFKLKIFRDASEELKDLFSGVTQFIPDTNDVLGLPIRDKTRTSKELERELDEVKTVLYATCQNVQSLKEELENLEKETADMSLKNRKMLEQKQNMESEITLLSNSKISSHDLQLVEDTKMRYKALRNMTQVKFNYESCDSDNLNGFVFNSANKKIKKFCIKNLAELSQEQISDQIIAAMEQIVGDNYADIPLE